MKLCGIITMITTANTMMIVRTINAGKITRIREE